MNNEPLPMELRLLTLLQKVRDERDDEARTELNDLLRTDSDARKTMAVSLVNEQAIISHLRDESIVSILNLKPMSVLPPKSTRGLQRRPLWAAAAGIVFGVLCTSVVFGYAISSSGNTITLLHESFESGSAPLVIGAPKESGVWSGDYSEIVGEQQSVNPETGMKMLRFLRADYEGKPTPAGSYAGDLYRLIDLRPYRHEFTDGSAVVQASAGFNSASFPERERYACAVRVCAISAEMVMSGEILNGASLRDGALATASKGLPQLDRDPRSWQRVESELRLPAVAEFLLIHLSVSNLTNDEIKDAFRSHYLDDVRVVLTRRAPLP